jgi:hypothetical protein
MKRFNDNFDNGGVGFQNEDWNTAQKEPLKAAESIIAGLQEPCIVSGGEINSVDGTNIDINSGYVFLNNAIMPFDAYTGAHGYLVEDTPTNETRFLQDGGTPFTFSTSRKAIYSPTQPVSGDWVRIYNEPYQYLTQVQFRQSHAKSSIVMVRSGSTEIFGQSIPTIDGTGLGLGFYNGFHLCDGTNGTINLIDKFVKGANIGTLGNEGGNSTINLEHNHKILETVSNAIDIVSFDQGGQPANVTISGGFASSAGSGINIPNVANTNFDFYSDKQLSNSQNIEPPFYQLYYMERI